MITHEAPGELVEFLGGFVDAPSRPVAGGFLFASIECITPEAFSERFSTDAPGPEAQGLAATRIEAFARHDEMLIVDARDAMGALIAFAAR